MPSPSWTERTSSNRAAASGSRPCATIGSRLHLVPRFRQLVYVPRRGLGRPLWVDAPAFDLSDHVQSLPLPAGCGEADPLVATERLRRERLDPSRPLWAMWFMTGLPNNQVAVFVKLHHAIADGMAAMAAISALLDTAPDAPAPPARPWTPLPLPSAGELLADNHLGHLQRLASALATPCPPPDHRAATAGGMAGDPRAPRRNADTRDQPGPGGPDRTLALVRTTLDQVSRSRTPTPRR